MSIEYFDVSGIRVANIKNSSEIAFFGIAVMAGSNYESPEISGIAHYSEHMAFKGTKKRNWSEINQRFAMLGANNNAYTSNNEVVYHATAPKESIPDLVEIMLDMFFNSTFPADEIEKERQVITEEKKMYDDDPKSAFSSAIGNNFFDWTLGHDGIGTFDTIKSISRDQIINYLNNTISPENIVFVCSGNVDTDLLKKSIEDNMPTEHPYLISKKLNNVGCELWSDLSGKKERVKLLVERENITQSNVCMLTQGLSVDHPNYHDLSVAYRCLGGGMYSSLYARIREELGLCYSVGMVNFSLNYPDQTVTELYGYVSPNNVEKFMDESEKILADTLANGLDPSIYLCAKTDYLSKILRNTETSAGKAMYLIQKLLLHKQSSYEDSIQKIRNVSIETSNEMICRMLKSKYNWAVMNPKEIK